nr:ribonuclease H-like domain-containing protein [Tanacetum cinerariifolium]
MTVVHELVVGECHEPNFEGSDSTWKAYIEYEGSWFIHVGLVGVPQRLPHPGQGILGPTSAIYSSQLTTLPSAFSIMSPQDLTWHMDTGDGKSIPVTNTGHNIIPSHHRPLHLYNVLVTSNIIKKLISVRQFSRDNNCTIEFNAFGFSVKDYLTHHILLRCDSSGDLYPVTKPSTSLIAFLSRKVLPRGFNVSDIRVIKCYVRLSLVILFHVIKKRLHIFVTLANLANM